MGTVKEAQEIINDFAASLKRINYTIDAMEDKKGALEYCAPIVALISFAARYMERLNASFAGITLEPEKDSVHTEFLDRLYNLFVLMQALADKGSKEEISLMCTRMNKIITEIALLEIIRAQAKVDEPGTCKKCHIPMDPTGAAGPFTNCNTWTCPQCGRIEPELGSCKMNEE